MCLMTKEIVVPVSDLQFMTVECSVCQTAVVLDMRKAVATGDEFIPAGGITPNQCPFCKAPYDVNADSINAFRAFYQHRTRKDCNTKISFRVKLDSESTA
jgi:endogenous inhibitor of DNA gyrase (YacG/DUF329 family)